MPRRLDDEFEDDITDDEGDYDDEEHDDDADVQADLVRRGDGQDGLEDEASEPRRPFGGTDRFPKALPRAITKELVIGDLMEMIENNVINLHADYQRDEVWTVKGAMDLIESLTLNVRIPELLFNVVKKRNTLVPRRQNKPWRAGDEKLIEDDGEAMVPEEVWDAADGKQRLTSMYKHSSLSSITRFYTNRIPTHGKHGIKHYYSRIPDDISAKIRSKRGVLTSKEREEFLQQPFSAAVYDNLTKPEVTLLFTRIQRGMKLTADEKMMAEQTGLTLWAKKLAERFCTDPITGFNWRISNLSRARDATSMLYCALNVGKPLKERKHLAPGTVTSKFVPSYVPQSEEKERLVEILERLQKLTLLQRSSSAPELLKKMSNILNRYVPDAEVPHEVFTEPKRLAPVELQWLPTLIEHFWERSNGELLEIIEEWRDHVNKGHKGEMKRNTAVVKDALNWIADFDTRAITKKYLDDGSRNPRPNRRQIVDQGTGNAGMKLAAAAKRRQEEEAAAAAANARRPSPSPPIPRPSGSGSRRQAQEGEPAIPNSARAVEAVPKKGVAKPPVKKQPNVLKRPAATPASSSAAPAASTSDVSKRQRTEEDAPSNPAAQPRISTFAPPEPTHLTGPEDAEQSRTKVADWRTHIQAGTSQAGLSPNPYQQGRSPNPYQDPVPIPHVPQLPNGYQYQPPQTQPTTDPRRRP
ncbi:hypothetical protein MNV49_002203 [Pseudohyphozyma bogoriensis]|nr:hypothetical protein MNV49_002203 [Pseudohyphozyma bogoriensis]